MEELVLFKDDVSHITHGDSPKKYVKKNIFFKKVTYFTFKSFKVIIKYFFGMNSNLS